MEDKIKKFIDNSKVSLNKKKYSTAIDDLLRAQKTDKENPEIYYLLGIAYIRAEKYEMAIECLNKVLESDLIYVNKLHTQMLLGYVYTLNDEYEEALKMFKGIIKAGFQSAQTYTAIGYIMDRLGKFKEAVINLYHAIEIDPKSPNTHNSLGYIFAEANINLNEALDECKKAIAIDKNNPAYLDSLGWVYYKLGNLSQAKSYLKKALKIAPDSEEIKDHLDTVIKTI